MSAFTHAPMSEETIEAQILNFLSLKRVYAYKNQTAGHYNEKRKMWQAPKSKYQIRGPSDILGMFSSTFLAIEVKTRDGHLTPEQHLFLTNILANGGIAFVARDWNEVRSLLFGDLSLADIRVTCAQMLELEKVKSTQKPRVRKPSP